MENFNANTITDFIIEIGSLLIICGILLVIGSAVTAAIRNKQPRWDMVVYIIAILGLALILLRNYPAMAIGATADGLESSSVEKMRLQAALYKWLPDALQGSEGAATLPATAEPSITDLVPTAVGEVTPVAVVDAVPTVRPTATPTAVPTATVVPTATAVPTLDMGIWNPATPPPTPEIGK
ncbi:MAG: hypothetical protein KDE47_11165 [Caldilineaceae bacterium]|nr:hypothetical protein [Caldilineaceae bacterium]